MANQATSNQMNGNAGRSPGIKELRGLSWTQWSMERKEAVICMDKFSKTPASPLLAVNSSLKPTKRWRRQGEKCMCAVNTKAGCCQSSLQQPRLMRIHTHTHANLAALRKWIPLSPSINSHGNWRSGRVHVTIRLMPSSSATTAPPFCCREIWNSVCLMNNKSGLVCSEGEGAKKAVYPNTQRQMLNTFVLREQ